MATSVTTNYNGDVVAELMTLVATQNQTVDGGHIYVSPNISNKRSLPRLRMDNVIQDRIADPVNSDSVGTMTMDERTLVVQDWMVFFTFNPNDFRNYWDFGQPRGQFVFSEMSPELQVDMMKEIIEGAGGVMPWMGKSIWQGDTAGAAPLNKFDGLLKKGAADADVVDVPTPVTLTEANIIAEFERVYQAARVEDRDDPNWKLFISSTDKDKYRRALQNLSNKSIDPTQDAPNLYNGRTIVPLVGMPENKMFATTGSASRASNIWLGLSGSNNEETLKVARLNEFAELWGFKMLGSADTQIKFGESVVGYNL